MDESVHKFLRSTGPVLCVDIGSGTQDALLARPGLECENWPRFVLPSPARMVAQRIRELTLLRRDLPLLTDAQASVPVSIAMSLAMPDERLRQTLEAGAPTFEARLQTVRAAADA